MIVEVDRSAAGGLLPQRIAAVLCLALPLSLVSAAVAKAGPVDRAARCESLVVDQAPSGPNRPRGFTLEIQGEARSRLLYLGVRHTFDSADSEIAAITAAFRDFRPTVAFFEGTQQSVGATMREAVEQGGEPGLIRYLASRAGIAAHSLEPTRDLEAQALLREFSAEQLVLFYVTRMVEEQRDRRGLRGRALDSLFVLSLDRVNQVRPLAGALPDTVAFFTAYRRWFPSGDPGSAPSIWFDPFHTSGETGSKFMNDVNRASSRFRDVSMVRTLAHACGPSARVFAAVGRDHVPAQAAALRCALQPQGARWPEQARPFGG
jgi:hypothetical protein